MTVPTASVTGVEATRPAIAVADAKPLMEMTARRARLSRAQLRELWEYREVLWAFAMRFIKIKYKQAAIGIGWAVVQPVASAGIFALVLGRYAHLPSDGAPYLLFALAGMVCWTYFATATGTATESIVADQGLMRKVYFPREALPLSAVSAALVDLTAAFATLTVATLLYGNVPALSWLALPIPVLTLITTAAAISLGFSALNVYYRDVRYVLPFILQLGLFASAVFYPLSLFPSPWETIWAVVNPIAAVITSVREIMIDGDWPNFAILAGALAWSIILLVLNYGLFKRLERSFADRA